MRCGPDPLTTEEIKALDKLVDVQIEDWQEEKHLAEIVKDEESYDN